MFLDFSDGANLFRSVGFSIRAVRVFPVLSLDAYSRPYGIFLMIFQPNCARGYLFSHHQFNPLSSNGDQHQFSPNDIHRLSRDKVMRDNKMIT